MSSFVLKIIAIITMFIDHLGHSLYTGISWMNYIGRLAFPIFAWQIAVGINKTRNIKLYLFRLLIVAIISQPLFMLVFNTTTFNTIFTLLLGTIGLAIFKKNEKVGIIALVIASIVAEYCKCDYGAYGIAMIAIFYMFMDKKCLMLGLQVILSLLYVFVIGRLLPIQLLSLVSVILLLLYNGKKGTNVKYLFYVFYPLHLLALAYLNTLI